MRYQEVCENGQKFQLILSHQYIWLGLFALPQGGVLVTDCVDKPNEGCQPLVSFVTAEQIGRELIFFRRKLRIFFDRQMVMLSVLSLEIEQDCQDQRLWQEIFFDFNIERTKVLLERLTRLATRFRIHLMALEIHLSGLLVDPIPYFHEMDRIIYERSGYTSSYCHVSCVQVHVATLDALNTQSS